MLLLGSAERWRQSQRVALDRSATKDEVSIGMLGKSIKNQILKSNRFSKNNLILFGLVFAAIGGYAIYRSFAAGGPTPMPLISQGKPAFSSSGGTASNANDSNYGTRWMGSIPGTLSYDLSSVPAAQRGQVLVAWYNDPMTSPYDHTLISNMAYNNLKSYTIDVNPAAGGGSAPTTGWITKVTVTNNVYHSRQHLIDMTGNNWIRINVTASDGSSGNTAAGINFDIHNANGGATDSWLLLGDSLIQDGMAHVPIDGGTSPNFSQLINTVNPNYYPSFEDGGIGGLTTNEMAGNINTWLSTFPGHYVGLSYGTNDANGGCNTAAFYNNYVTAVNAVIAAGKVPVIPTIPASPSAAVKSCGPSINAKIQQLYTTYPQIVHGPDLWTFFSTRQNEFRDNLHPNAQGYADMKQQWANAMIANVYSVADTTGR